jgi:hypothetical protein
MARNNLTYMYFPGFSVKFFFQSIYTDYALKRHSLMEKSEIKITNLRFASLFVEICR